MAKLAPLQMMFALLVLTISSLGARVANGELRSIAVIHRHGARYGVGFVNGSATCNAPFCELTDQGKRQCMAVGEKIRADYFDQFGWQAHPYNVSLIHSESTSVSRVVISGEAAVMGMWPNSLPFVDFVKNTDDLLLSMWTSWPAWKIRSTYSVEEAKMNTALIMTPLEPLLNRITELYGLNCKVNAMECIMFAQDNLAANRSLGWISDPILEEHWEDFRSVVARFFSELLAYDPADPYDRQLGALGYPFMSYLFGRFANELTDPNVALQRMHHFAVHDWTLMAFYGTIGIWTPANRTDERFVPRFAETLVMEHHLIDGVSHIKARWGYPTQEAVPSPVLNLTDARILCINDAGSVYSSLDSPNGCRLDHLWRYINHTAPQSPSGVCYATPEMIEQQNCHLTTPPPEHSRCYFYRHKCPAEDCALIPGAISDAANGFACAVPEAPSYLLSTILALTIPFAIVGAGLGFVAIPKINALLSKDDSQKYQDESTPIAR
jgi:hypothetical protein